MPTLSADAPPLLDMRGITKSYPGVKALRGVDLTLCVPVNRRRHIGNDSIFDGDFESALAGNLRVANEKIRHGGKMWR